MDETIEIKDKLTKFLNHVLDLVSLTPFSGLGLVLAQVLK
jgi:hypothetical protein